MMGQPLNDVEIMKQWALQQNNPIATLADVLGAEQARQAKLKEIRVKYGRPEPPQKLKPKNPVQWMGDNRG